MLPRRSKGIPLAVLFLLTMLSTVSGELPVETFFRNFERHQARLSPSGRYLATLSPRGPRVGLAVVDLQTRAAQWAFTSARFDVRGLVWVNEERLLLGVGHEDVAFGGLVAVNRDGTQVRPIESDRFWGFRYLSPVSGSTNEVFVECMPWAKDVMFPHIARLNVYHGRFGPGTTNPGYVIGWLADHEGVPRLGIGVDGGRFRIIHRWSLRKPWETIAAFGPTEDGPDPEAFTADGRALYVLCGGGEDTLGLYRFDLERRKPVELLFRHKEVDIVGVTLHPQTHALAGVAYESERLRVFWIDPECQQFQVSIDRAFTNCLNLRASASRDGSKVVLLSTNDRNPGTYHLVDWSTKKLEKLFDVAPWIHAEQMAEMKPISFRARDGLLLRGYLSVPVSGPPTNLPLVINPHGGPWARDSWGFDPEVQFPVNRGYAVLRVNYRGSSVYGLAFLRAGDKQWGRKMQEDLTDGVKWAIAQGVADPNRVAILGASYGGYAAMAGLAFTPELYRCGVNLSGVTDIEGFIKRREQRPRISRAHASQAIGDPKREKEQLEEVSPLNFVERIRAPVFLAYGGLDRRVPIDQGKKLAAELNEQGKTYELMIKDDEGHGFSKEENRIELYQRLDAFLKLYLK